MSKELLVSHHLLPAAPPTPWTMLSANTDIDQKRHADRGDKLPLKKI